MNTNEVPTAETENVPATPETTAVAAAPAPVAEAPKKVQASPELIERVTAAVHANGGKLEALQCEQIANQIARGTVPTQMICIASGQVLSIANKTLRLRRLAVAKGETHEEKLFNLLTSYRSLAMREKAPKTGPSYHYKARKVHTRTGYRSDLLEGVSIADATIIVAAGDDDQCRRIVIEDGVIVKDEMFKNGKPEDFVKEAPSAPAAETPATEQAAA